MIRIAVTLSLMLLPCVNAWAQQPTFHDALLDQLCGRWVLRGTIAGQKIVHDVSADWVLNHQYVFWRETSREKNKDGQPAYANHFYFGWDGPTRSHVCVILDTFGDISTESLGHVKEPSPPNSLSFVFEEIKGGRFHATFRHHDDENIWEMNMDEEKNGRLTPFARTKLTRD